MRQFSSSPFSRAFARAAFPFLLVVALTSSPLVGQAIAIDSYPTGMKPLGIGGATGGTVVVANSGDDSISIFRLLYDSKTQISSLQFIKTVQGIPGPYAVKGCGGPQVLVVSPADNSVRVIQVPEGALVATIHVGREPRAVACYAGFVVVSNVGDSTLTILDQNTFAITATIPGVPGARVLHGIAIYANGYGRIVAWVAGTDANLVTLVDLVKGTVITQIPVTRPTIVDGLGVACCCCSVANAAGALATYDPETLKLLGTYTGPPNPQDLYSNGLGFFEVLGGQDSLLRLTGDSSTHGTTASTTLIPIPGAAALSGSYQPTSFGIARSDVVLITSTSSNRLYLIQQQPLFTGEFGIGNGASFLSSPAPGSLAAAGGPTGVVGNVLATTVPLPTSLGGVSLKIGGTLSFSATSGWTYSATGSVQAGLYYVGPNQINFQVPPGIAVASSVPAQLTKADGSTLLTTVNLRDTAPGIFTVLQNGQGQGAVLNQDYSLNGDPQIRVGAKPAARGSVIQIYATGGGATTPALAAGEAAPSSGNPLIYTVAQPTVTIGGKTARVLFSGLTPGLVGLWQINAEIPADVTPGFAVPLSISTGTASSNPVTIAVQ